MTFTNARTGTPLATKYVQHVFGQERSTLDTAYPGDVIGAGQRHQPAHRRHPAAGVVFAGEVDRRTANDSRVADLQARVAETDGAQRAELSTQLTEAIHQG